MLLEWHRLQQKSLNTLGLPNNKGGLGITKRAVGKDAKASFAKKKRNRTMSSDCEMANSQSGQKQYLGKKGKG